MVNDLARSGQVRRLKVQNWGESSTPTSQLAGAESAYRAASERASRLPSCITKAYGTYPGKDLANH